MFDPFFNAIAAVLAWFYDLVPSYAFAIAGLTLTVMIVLTPLTLKGTRSMMALQRLQPELKKIQQEHKGDRQKLNEELMKFYQENKINPLGGCLPLLLQMPVFIVLYQVLIGLTYIPPGGTNFQPKYLSPDSSLYQSLANANPPEMYALGMDLSKSAAYQFSQSFVGSLPYLLLVLAVAGTSYYQQRQVSARNPNASMTQQQQLLLKVLPAFFAVISLTLPSGIVLYFLVSNLYRIGQQAFISRTMAKEAVAAGGPIEATAKEVPAAGGAEGDKPGGMRGLLAGFGRKPAGEDEGSGAAGDAPAKGSSGPGTARPGSSGKGGAGGGGAKGSSGGGKGSSGPAKGASTAGKGKGGATPPPSGRVTPKKSSPAKPGSRPAPAGPSAPGKGSSSGGYRPGGGAKKGTSSDAGDGDAGRGRRKR